MNKSMQGKTIEQVNASLARRYAKDRRFRRLGLAAIFSGLAFVLMLFGSIVSNGYSAFGQTYLRLNINFDPQLLGVAPLQNGAGYELKTLQQGDYGALVKAALRAEFPEVKSRSDLRELYSLISSGAPRDLQQMVLSNPAIIGSSQSLWLIADDDIDMVVKGYINRKVAESERRVNDQKIAWIEQLEAKAAVARQFNTRFFTNGDSREPELAGIGGAIMGSFYTLLITLVLSFPIGVSAAIYLEEFAPRNRWTDLIEVNINNLAAVPSIVFGLLGMAVFINFMQMPRSAPLVGGLVLTLMTLPTIIIASRAALKAVPPSIREAALGIGASKLQMVGQHVLPLALPGMLTGAIIGMAQALGESAPLLMIGMVAFIVDVPAGIYDPSTVLPVQIFLWADSPERAFVERTSAAIMVLLLFLLLMNLVAILLRRRFERRW
ncbi:MAG: phosphate ABC transporter permease PstA [Gammaproteobacteria bacterium]|nr:phosphate ABC transporter permease PstA [Gammaproteobacteria bacterium]